MARKTRSPNTAEPETKVSAAAPGREAEPQRLADEALVQRKSPRPSLRLGSLALGAMALGAFAIGFVAIGRLSIGRASVGRVRLGGVDIDNLVVRKLSVLELDDKR